MAKTVLFIHGAWLTPDSWNGFMEPFKAAGYECIAPAWPYMDRPIDQLRNNPAPELKHLGVSDIVDHYAGIIATLPEQPILVGHSFGGLVVQRLLDRGLGIAGVAIDPAPPRGVLAAPAAVVTSLAVLGSWRGWAKVHSMSEKAFRKGFAGKLTPEQQTHYYRNNIVPAPGRIFFQAAFGAQTGVKFKNPARPPLFLTAGLEDKTVPPSMVRSNYKKQTRAGSPTELLELPGFCHFVMVQEGWQTVADKILTWLKSTAK
ncbi:alpha/beta fold hydrolase [soil metagenome]